LQNPIETALAYKHKFGFCVVPCNGKIPLVDWKDWQKDQPSDEKIRLWWTRWADAGIAVVTGKVSGGICAVDLDGYKDSFQSAPIDNLIGDSLEMPISITPSGGQHWWFRTKEQLGDRIGFLPATDFRSGGIIILPFSEGYKWRVKLSDVEIPSLPEALVNVIKTSSSKPTKDKRPVTGKYYGDGRRDNDVFSMVNAMIKNGCDPMFVEDTVNRLTADWKDVIPDFAKIKVQSALKRHTEITLVEDVKSWVEDATGDFKVTSIYQDLQLSVKDKKTCLHILARLVESGELESASHANGHYRKVNKIVKKMDWRNVKLGNYYDIKFPLGLHDLFNISKTNLMVVAGSSNAGKTAFSMNVALLNKHQPVKYLCTEMDETELAERIAGFEQPPEAWDHVEFIKLDGQAGDYIDPDGLNIVDYIEPADGEFYKMQGLINDIHAKLKDGVALINIQKKRGELYGKGGSGTEERCRLYITMEFQELTLVKVKSPKKLKGFDQPEIQGKVIKFKLHNFSNFYEMERN
jgi:adenosyl cobinamide kinase/adenosyl cobinamide phosphate guanylyltransferase